MNIKIRIYTKQGNIYDTRTVEINEFELDEIIGKYLLEESYLKDGEILDGISYEHIGM